MPNKKNTAEMKVATNKSQIYCGIPKIFFKVKDLIGGDKN